MEGKTTSNAAQLKVTVGRPRPADLQLLRGRGAHQSPLHIPPLLPDGFLARPATVGQVTGATPADSIPHPRSALVGQCPIVEIQVNDHAVQCLVDTGSQDTVFAESLCKELFGQSLGQG